MRSGKQALDQCAAMLAEKGYKLNAGFYVNMPGNNITLSSAMPAEKQAPLFTEASAKAANITAKVVA